MKSQLVPSVMLRPDCGNVMASWPRGCEGGDANGLAPAANETFDAAIQNARPGLEIRDSAPMLENGGFAVSGAAKELAANPRVLEAYLGSRFGMERM